MKPIYKVRNNCHKCNFWFSSIEEAIADIEWYTSEKLEWSKIENSFFFNGPTGHNNIVMVSTQPKDIHQTPYEIWEEFIFDKPRGSLNAAK